MLMLLAHLLSRKRINDALTWYLWVRQGRPTAVPIVFRVGKLITYSDDSRLITQWGLDCKYMDRMIDLQTLWDYLVLEYPQTHTFPRGVSNKEIS